MVRTSAWDRYGRNDPGEPESRLSPNDVIADISKVSPSNTLLAKVDTHALELHCVANSQSAR